MASLAVVLSYWHVSRAAGVVAVQTYPTRRCAVLQVLVDDAMVASWMREGLPSDPTSVQNGAILTNSERWPLMLDPQLQGIAWTKSREATHNLKVRNVC